MQANKSFMTSASLVALAMMVMNAFAFAYTLAGARLLMPEQFGALTALLGIVLVGTVPALALQAVLARRISIEPGQAVAIARASVKVAFVVAGGVGVVVASSTIVLKPAFNLDTWWAIVWAGCAVVPFTIASAQMGIAQGLGRWRLLAAMYLLNGVGRLGGGLGAMLIAPTAASAMFGLALGLWLPTLVGFVLFRPAGSIEAEGTRGKALFIETVVSSTTLLAYFAFSNVDALIARGAFSELHSGLYAAGLILTKSTLFLPQFVSVVFFPSLARDATQQVRLKVVAMVVLLGSIAIALTAFLPHLALILVGGGRYAAISHHLWVFALSGTCLAVLYVLVFDALARRTRGVAWLLWGGTLLVLAIAKVFSLTIYDLAETMASIAAVMAVVLLAWPFASERLRARSGRSQ